MDASPSPTDDDTRDRLSRGLEPVGTGEWVMLGLAAVNVLLLFVADSYAVFLPALVAKLVIPIDLALVVIYGLEFLGRLGRTDRKLAFVKNHWYDVVGLVPISSVTFRAFRLVRLVRIYVVSRLDWEGEPSWHKAFVRGVIRRYLDILLQELTAPIMFAGVQMVKKPLRKARFAALMGKIIDTQRRQVHAVVGVTLENTKGVKQMAGTKAGQRLTEAVTEAVLDTVVDTLKSDEMNELVANATEDVLNEVTSNMTGAEAPVAEAVEAAGPDARPADPA